MYYSTKDYGFSHVTSSPGHASGNGEVEQAVHTVKELLYAAQDPYSALLKYRSTPLANGYSPAELLMSRKIRTKLPELPRNLEPVLPKQQRLQEKEETSQVNMKLNFDKHHATKSLPVCEIGMKYGYTIGRKLGECKDKVVVTRTGLM